MWYILPHKTKRKAGERVETFTISIGYTATTVPKDKLSNLSPAPLDLSSGSLGHTGNTEKTVDMLGSLKSLSKARVPMKYHRDPCGGPLEVKISELILIPNGSSS